MNMLFDEHKAWLMSVCKTLAFSNRWDVDECIQEGYLGFREACDRHTPDKGPLTAFAYLRVRGAIIDYHRNKIWAVGSRSGKQEGEYIEFYDEDSHGSCEASEVEHPLSDLIKTLSPLDRSIVTRRLVHGEDWKSIADSIGFVPSSTHYRYTKSIEALRQVHSTGETT